MKKSILSIFVLLCAVLSSFGADGVIPEIGWEPSGYQYNMTYYAQVLREDNTYIESEESILAVFDASGNCRGAITPIEGPTGWLFQMIISANATSEPGLTMKIFDATTGATYDIEETVDFANDAIIPEDGIINPLQLHAVGTEVTEPTYKVTVNDVVHDGYKAGETVSFEAPAAPEGKAFSKWTSVGVTLANPADTTASFTMPANDVTLTAQYEDISSGGQEAPTDWEVAGGYQYNMTYYAQVLRGDNTYIESEESILAVFDASGNCRGAITPIEGPMCWLFQMIISANATSEPGLMMKIFDAETGEIYDIQETVDFANDAIIPEDGIINPLQLHVKGNDTTPPTLTITGNATAWTNQNVVLTATATDEESEVESLQYTLDGTTWAEYPASGVTITANGTVTFRATDANGNTATQTVVVDKIDKVLPTITSIATSTIEPTNQDVTVTAVFADDKALQGKEYRIGSGTWQSYTSGVTVTANAIVTFRATDQAGNTATASYEVTNIDKVPPTITNITASTTAPTNQDVTVTATFADNVALQTKEYRIGSGAWQNYSSGVIVTANATIAFRATDKAGNTATASYEVTNIDKVPPTITDITPSTTEPTNQDVTVTVVFADDVALQTKEFRIGSGAWQTYDAGVVVTENATVTFRATDMAGNVKTASISIQNINKVLPQKPEVIRRWLSVDDNRRNVMVEVEVGERSDECQISLNGTDWSSDYYSRNYGHNSWTFTVYDGEGCTVYFRSIGESGNVSETTIYELPEAPHMEIFDSDNDNEWTGSQWTSNEWTDYRTIIVLVIDDWDYFWSPQYSFDGETWQNFGKEDVWGIPESVLFDHDEGILYVSENCTVFFRFEECNTGWEFRQTVVIDNIAREIQLLSPGWNLVSFAFKPEGNVLEKLLALKPFAQEGNSYVQAKSLEANRGYWFYVSEETTLPILLKRKASDIQVSGNWILMGAASDPPPWLEQVALPIFRWEEAKGFVPEEFPEVGTGYWVNYQK